jgi:DMSO/TMAO reductase YedYZ molybdopterin-dependent catalytic subunit
VAAMPSFAPFDLVAPLVSVAVGVFVMRRLHDLALRSEFALRSEASRSLHNPEGVSRRTVLGVSVAVGAGSLVAGGVGALLGRGTGSSQEEVTARIAAARIAEPAPPIPATAAFPESGTPTFLTSATDFYRIDTALRIPRLNAADWQLRIHGMVDRELTLTFDDVMNRPLVERPITMTCVSNPVGGDLISTANFVGADLRAILLEAGVRPGADQALATSVDGWYTGTPVDVLLQPDRGAMLAVGMNGAALPPEHGFPVRMVVPGLYGYVSATKWITDLELTTFAARSGYWYERGWAEKGPIKTGSRIDAPRAGQAVPAGRVTVAGIAWSQPDGISRVEVSVDGGPWSDADLATEVSGNTWRMWRTDLVLVPGSHTVQCRATTVTGVTQTATYADPVPDGASGWPALPFTVV